MTLKYHISAFHSATLAALFGIVALTGNTVSASQQAQVAVGGSDDLLKLMRGGFDVTALVGDSAVVILPDETEFQRLQATGLPFSITQDNLEAYLARRLAPGRDDMGGYMTFSEIVERMNALHDDYPDIVGEPVSIGETLGERDLWAMRVSDNPDEDEDEPEVLYTALTHCREVITAEVLFGVMERLTENYDIDTSLTELVNTRQLWFIPCLNPDGYAYNEQIAPNGGGLWRKNRRNNGDGTYGVDLNRNFGYEWGYDNIGSSPDPARETYRGPEAFSELETQAVRDFVNNHNIVTALNFHSYSNLCLYPWGYDYIQAPDRSLLTSLAMKMTSENNYTYGTGWEAIYITNGESDDWLYGSDEHNRIMALTIELGTLIDNFWPPLERVEPLVEENILPCLTIAAFADNPARALRPPTPTEVAAYLTEDGYPQVSWSVGDDNDNPAVGFKVQRFIPDQSFFDDAPEGQELWDLTNFNFSDANPHSGSYSYQVRTTEDVATLALREEIAAPDTFFAWLNYNLYPLKHYLALEISTDGFGWTPLSGRDTSDLVINDHNLGPGATGNSEGWVRSWWTTGDYAGDMVRLRFRYYRLDVHRNGELCFIDDIGPFPGYAQREIVADELEDTLWTDPNGDDDDRLYQVRSQDAEGDFSFWSTPVPVGGQLATITYFVDEGWNQIGFPIAPRHRALYSVFVRWIENGTLSVIKDGAGRLFLPDRELDELDEWNPLAGYLIKMTAADSLAILGEPADPGTPIELIEGWNLVAYLPLNPLPDNVALETISDNLTLVKNGAGDFWAPNYLFDNLNELELNQGYWVLMSAPDTLIYPQEGLIQSRTVQLRSTAGEKGSLICQDNQSLVFLIDSEWDEGELVLWDDDGFAVGRCRVDGANIAGGQLIAGMAALGAPPGGAGYTEGESLKVEWQSPTGISMPLSLIAERGSLVYKTNGFSVFRAKPALLADVPGEYPALAAYPNPFNSATHIVFNLAEGGHTRLAIRDVSGRMVEQLINGQLGAGGHRIRWTADRLPSGIYFARLTQSGAVAIQRTIKLLVIQ